MSCIRDDLRVVSVAVPVKLKKYLDRQIENDGFGCQSDFLRYLLVEYLRGSVPPGELVDIQREIEVMVKGRHR